jgi:hypothetical protein
MDDALHENHPPARWFPKDAVHRSNHDLFSARREKGFFAKKWFLD